MKYILNISIYLSLHAMISMWSVFYTYTEGSLYSLLESNLITITDLYIESRCNNMTDRLETTCLKTHQK